MIVDSGLSEADVGTGHCCFKLNDAASCSFGLGMVESGDMEGQCSNHIPGV